MNFNAKDFQGKGTACGKFILIGEHFIISQDSAAIAFPLKDLECNVTVTPDHRMRFFPKTSTRHSFNEEQIKSLMNRSTHAGADALRINISSQPLCVESNTNFPVSRGFGSSASFSIALARALMDYRMKIDSKWELTDPHQEIEKGAHAIEKIFHGTPSGIDAATILRMCGIHLEKGTIIKLQNKIVDFVLVDSGDRNPCVALVQKVAGLKNSDPQKWTSHAKTVNDACNILLACFEKNTLIGFGAAITAAGEVLTTLGLVTACAQDIIKTAQKYGALAGKISGAGGGGAVVIACEKGSGAAMASKLAENGFDVVTTSI